MATSFDALKKNRSSSLNKLNAQLEKISTKSYSDPNEGKMWKPQRDKAGNGFAIIRFLPAAQGEEMPFVRIWDHGFQGPTGLWYIENSLTTLNQDDPVSEFNGKLWNKELAIIELKQKKLNRNSAIFRQLKALQIHPASISKYCLGMSTAYPALKTNNFKPVFRNILKNIA